VFDFPEMMRRGVVVVEEGAGETLSLHRLIQSLAIQRKNNFNFTPHNEHYKEQLFC
jgi:hypothetical protein